jgi:hypothetical protein
VDALGLLNELEIVCLKKLAELYEKGQFNWNKEQGFETIGLTEINFRPILTTLENAGYISTDQICGMWMGSISIKGSVVLAARMIAKEENRRKDIMEYVKVTLREHPVIGWFFVISSAIVGLAIAITQIGGALKILGIIK